MYFFFFFLKEGDINVFIYIYQQFSHHYVKSNVYSSIYNLKWQLDVNQLFSGEIVDFINTVRTVRYLNALLEIINSIPQRLPVLSQISDYEGNKSLYLCLKK